MTTARQGLSSQSSLFKNLSTSTKLLILCGTFIVAVAAAIYSLVAEKQIAIEFARKALMSEVRPTFVEVDEATAEWREAA